MDLKVKLGHKSHARVRVWSCSRANGTRSSSAKTGMTNRTIVVEVDAPSVVLVVYIKINNDFVCRVIINPCFGSKRSRSPFIWKDTIVGDRPPCNFLNWHGVSTYPLASGRNILPPWFAETVSLFIAFDSNIVRNWFAGRKKLPPEIETTTARRNFIPRPASLMR